MEQHEITHAADELGEAGFTLDELAEAAGTTNTQAAVSLAFMKERGCVVTRYRRCFAASGCLFEDAMIASCSINQPTHQAASR